MIAQLQGLTMPTILLHLAYFIVPTCNQPGIGWHLQTQLFLRLGNGVLLQKLLFPYFSLFLPIVVHQNPKTSLGPYQTTRATGPRCWPWTCYAMPIAAWAPKNACSLHRALVLQVVMLDFSSLIFWELVMVILHNANFILSSNAPTLLCKAQYSNVE